jgi:hypothetical protein
MSIKFTKHALERLKSRSISKEIVLEIINNYDSLQKDKYGNFIAQKKKDKYLYRVFYSIKEDDKLIITTCNCL